MTRIEPNSVHGHLTVLTTRVKFVTVTKRVKRRTAVVRCDCGHVYEAGVQTIKDAGRGRSQSCNACRIYKNGITTARRADLNARNQTIRERAAAGENLNDIAKSYLLTRVRIHQIVTGRKTKHK